MASLSDVPVFNEHLPNKINNVLDIPIKLREAQMENKKTIEADSFGICA
jgi:hypothetical protein